MRCLVIVVLAGCSDGICVEARVTIAQGLYGQVTSRSDVGPSTPQPVRGELITVLAAGQYQLCQPALPPCVSFSVASRQRTRVDLVEGFGTAWDVVAASGCS